MSVDRILDIIDAGLQHSNEEAYGTDRGDAVCWRCQRAAPGEGASGVCDSCRAVLLDEETPVPDGWGPLRVFFDEPRIAAPEGSVALDISDGATAYTMVVNGEWVEIGTIAPTRVYEPLDSDPNDLGHQLINNAVVTREEFARSLDVPEGLIASGGFCAPISGYVHERLQVGAIRATPLVATDVEMDGVVFQVFLPEGPSPDPS